MVEDTRVQARPPDSASGRVASRWGFTFFVLLLVSAGMVTVPGGDDSVTFVRDFYTAHTAVIVIAQVIGLGAAAAFVIFARLLQARTWVGRSPWVLAGGVSVGAASVLTAVPPLVLCGVADSAGADTISALATASDLVDVVQFLTIAAFGAAVVSAVQVTWVRVLSGLVTVLCGVHAVLLLLGETPVELAAALSFLALVVSLATLCWRRA